MENLGDILNRLSRTRRANGGRHESGDDWTLPERPEDRCPICEGRRWLAIEVPVGHPDFGKAEPCGCQADVAVVERESRLRRYSNLGALSSRTFGSIDPDGRGLDAESRRTFRAACEASLAYAEEPTGWLVLTGPNGSGKTHLAAAIANRCIEAGNPVFFVHVPDLLDDLRSTYAPTSELSYSDLFDQVNEAPLLVLDGLGAQSSTPWAQEKLQQIFNRRASGDLPTVVTTALDVAEIDPYISSRMSDPELSRVVEVKGRVDGPATKIGSIPEIMLRTMTFESFDTDGNMATDEQRRSLRVAYDQSLAFAKDPDGWLTLFGSTGVGKTHLAVAVAGELIRRGHSVVFTSVPDLLDHLRDAFQPNRAFSYDRLFDRVKDAPFLVLDDLGREHTSPWATEKLYQIVAYRHNSRLPTLITTAQDLPGTGGPITSRIQDHRLAMVARMEAPDYRRNAGPGAR